jgi:hypothetical protein
VAGPWAGEGGARVPAGGRGVAGPWEGGVGGAPTPQMWTFLMDASTVDAPVNAEMNQAGPVTPSSQALPLGWL